MKQIIESFDRSYIINLQDRVDRRHAVEREFSRLGITIPNHNIKYYSATRPTDKGNFHDIGVRGCFMSHLNILEMAQMDRLGNVLIFEDDVTFRDVGADLQKRLLENLAHRDWDLLWLGYLSPSDENLTGPLLRWENDIRATHCYAVNGRFIPTMVQYMKDCLLRPRNHPDGGPMPADGAYNHVRYVIKDITLLLAVPALAYQRNSRSDITSRSPTLDKMVWLRPFVHGARNLKHQLRMNLDKYKLRRRMDGS